MPELPEIASRAQEMKSTLIGKTISNIEVISYLSETFPNRQELCASSLVNITTGWENDMYAFDLDYMIEGEPRQEGLVLRIYPGDDAHEKAAHEFEGMHLLYKAGYPVPEVYLLEREASPFKRPFMIMQRVEGNVMWPVLTQSTPAKQADLISTFCDLFVRLHRLDWRPFVKDPDEVEHGSPYQFVDYWLARGKSLLEQFPYCGLDPILDWLEARRELVPCDEPSVAHFDFHPNNIILQKDWQAVVIDWPAMNVTDARFDLAWTMLLAHAHMGEGWRDRILKEYERLSSASIDQLAFFEVFACLRRLFDASVSLSAGAERLGMRPEAVQSMKENKLAYKRVYELLVDRTGIRISETERLLEDLST